VIASLRDWKMTNGSSAASSSMGRISRLKMGVVMIPGYFPSIISHFSFVILKLHSSNGLTNGKWKMRNGK
jgi:hypothetical protein